MHNESDTAKTKITADLRLRLLSNGVLSREQRDILEKSTWRPVSLTGKELVGRYVSSCAYADAFLAKPESGVEKNKTATPTTANHGAKNRAKKARAEKRAKARAAVAAQQAEWHRKNAEELAKKIGVTSQVANARTKEDDIAAALYVNRHMSREQKDKLFRSMRWKQLRYEALKRAGGHCQCCGALPSQGRPLHVDHIQPLADGGSALSLDNLQVLCADCNEGKGSWDSTDWRAEKHPVLLEDLDASSQAHMRDILH